MFPHQTQQRVLESTKRYRVVIGGRRWGKTTLCSLAAQQAHAIRKSRMLYVTLSNAMMRTQWRLFRSLIDSGELDYTMPGSDFTRGKEYDFIMIDNAEYIPQSFYEESLHPCILDSNGKLLMVGSFLSETANMPLLWKMYGFALDPENKDAEAFTFPTSDNPYISQDQMDEAKRTMPQDLYEAQLMSNMVRPR